MAGPRILIIELGRVGRTDEPYAFDDCSTPRQRRHPSGCCFASARESCSVSPGHCPPFEVIDPTQKQGPKCSVKSAEIPAQTPPLLSGSGAIQRPEKEHPHGDAEDVSTAARGGVQRGHE